MAGANPARHKAGRAGSTVGPGTGDTLEMRLETWYGTMKMPDEWWIEQDDLFGLKQRDFAVLVSICGDFFGMFSMGWYLGSVGMMKVNLYQNRSIYFLRRTVGYMNANDFFDEHLKLSVPRE